MVNRNWTELTRHGNLDNWREILAALVTYASPEDFAPLCGTHQLMQPLRGLFPAEAVMSALCAAVTAPPSPHRPAW